jgi:hypothetical protein
MSLISKETLLMHLQRAEMASDVKLPIEFFRDLIYQAMPRPWIELTDKEIWGTISRIGTSDSDVDPYTKLADARAIEAKLKEKNT